MVSTCLFSDLFSNISSTSRNVLVQYYEFNAHLLNELNEWNAQYGLTLHAKVEVVHSSWLECSESGPEMSLLCHSAKCRWELKYVRFYEGIKRHWEGLNFWARTIHCAFNSSVVLHSPVYVISSRIPIVTCIFSLSSPWLWELHSLCPE